MDKFDYNLVLMHIPNFQHIGDFLTIRNMMLGIAPEIRTLIASRIDGRIQLPVITFLRKRFNVENVDLITEPGINRILAEQLNNNLIESIFSRLLISVEKHNSVGAAIVGHYDCAGNIADREEQIQHIKESIKLIRQRFIELEIIGLWIDEFWEVNEI